MKNLFAILLILCNTMLFAQTANDFSTYKAYQSPNFFGINQGYYTKSDGSGLSYWSSQNTAKIAADLGANTLRVPLYDSYLNQYGLTGEMPDINYYISLGYKHFTAFIGMPSSTNQLDSTFPGTTEKSQVWKGMYQPIWLDVAKTQINPSNTFASYLYSVVKTYGNYVTSYEIINEPDYTYSSGGWSGDSNPPGQDSWFFNNPTASDLVNLRANIFWYNRLLRISWDVIKTLQPNAHVCTGGIGNRSFLDAILRNTDNPVDGSVSSQYPLKGGAYLDVISFHDYPQYQLRQWSNAVGGFVYQRHSDAAVQAGFLKIKGWMDSLCQKYGYDDKTYPKKQFICTETAIGRVMNNDELGSDSSSRNYVTKAYVASQKSGVRQLYWFNLGDGSTTYVFDRMGLYYFFGDAQPTGTITKTNTGIAFGTMAKVLAQTSYDSVKTKSINFPVGVDGAAFKKANGLYIYVLWAKTTTDMSEAASGLFTFSTGQNLIHRKWDYNVTNIQDTVTGTVKLNGTPEFFEETNAIVTPPPVVDTIPQVVLPIGIQSFTITYSWGTNILAWVVNDESGTYNYELQRSTDGVNFYSIYTISCTGSGSTYKRTDANPPDGKNWYRLQINNWKASHTYSNVVMYDNSQHFVNVWVYNVAGQLLLIKYTNDLPALERTLKPGIYILKILSGTTMSSQKIIIP